MRWTALFGLAALIATLAFEPLPADAQEYTPYYPWCANYNNGASNCSFSTWQQCEATISGIGGTCDPN